jgi:hypothetical protein
MKSRGGIKKNEHTPVREINLFFCLAMDIRWTYITPF